MFKEKGFSIFFVTSPSVPYNISNTPSGTRSWAGKEAKEYSLPVSFIFIKTAPFLLTSILNETKQSKFSWVKESGIINKGESSYKEINEYGFLYVTFNPKRIITFFNKSLEDIIAISSSILTAPPEILPSPNDFINPAASPNPMLPPLPRFLSSWIFIRATNS